MIANIRKAIWDRETVTIGGGQFSGEELRLLLRQAQLGAALEKVCGELPEDCEVIVSLERGAASVHLIDKDGNEHNLMTEHGLDDELDQAVKLAKNTPPDDGPGEEDGPWAEGWAERSGQKPPTGYTAEELERDSPFNAWLHDGDAPDERDE